ncbi:MAG TPA: PqqD family protein [Vicinamibacterales bacterium]|nr:PqqD family protein [Vicinamibacterales bacterium]
MSVALEQSVRIPEDVVFRELQGEAVILNLTSSMYFGLDPVGTRIWQLCETHGSLRAVWDAMQHEFDAPGDRLRSDLLTFVDELLDKGLLAIR